MIAGHPPSHDGDQAPPAAPKGAPGGDIGGAISRFGTLTRPTEVEATFNRIPQPAHTALIGAGREQYARSFPGDVCPAGSVARFGRIDSDSGRNRCGSSGARAMT